MAFDPERDGWRLNEAIMRLSDPEALAALERDCVAAEGKDGRSRLPPWWLKGIAPAPRRGTSDATDLDRRPYAQRVAIERAFVDRLTRGEVVAWARHDSPTRRRERVPADAWPVLSADMALWDWHDGAMRVRETRTSPSPPPVSWHRRSGDRAPRTWREQGWPPQRTTEVVQRLYSVRVEPPSQFRRIGTRASEARCRAWLVELMETQPESPRPKAMVMEEALALFNITQAAFRRAWSGALGATGSSWGKAGRRKSSS
jgi:hypothetical protein